MDDPSSEVHQSEAEEKSDRIIVGKPNLGEKSELDVFCSANP
jgi:hypothetical protein